MARRIPQPRTVEPLLLDAGAQQAAPPRRARWRMQRAPRARRAAAAAAALAVAVASSCIAVWRWRASEAAHPPPLILLRRATLRPAARSVALRAAPAAAAAADDTWWAGSCAGTEQYLVALAPPVTAARRAALVAALARNGGALAGYVPSHSFLVLGNAATLAHLARLPHVLHLAAFEPAWRIAPELEDALGGNASAAERLRVELVTVSAPGLRLDVVRAAAAALLRGHGSVLSESAAVAGRSQAASSRAAMTNAVVHGKLLLELDAAATPRLLTQLAAQPWAHWLAPAPDVRLQNFMSASLLQQQSAQASGTAVARPLWQAGLRGEGQLIGIGDSGVDVRSCYFADVDANGTAVPPGPDHRKLVSYNAAFADAFDANGHGTHTAGSLAGACAPGYPSAPANASDWNGMAPAARLAFTDLGAGAGGRLVLPASLSDFFAHAYSLGGRVHSNSWGGNLTAYDVLSREVDEFCYEHRDFLPVFAAGNFGAGQGAAHVANPATSKNALAVGATRGAGGAHAEDAAAWDARVCELEAAGVTTTRLLLADVAFAASPLGRAPPSKSWSLVLPEPPELCAPPEPAAAAALRGEVLLLARGGCDVDAKLAIAHAAGAAAVLIHNNETSGYFALPHTASLRITAATLPLAEGVRLRSALLAAGGRLAARFSPSRASRAPEDSVAAFSSFGPTHDGRTKPDLVAPGETRSAAAASLAAQQLAGGLGSCATATSAGTSMAAPIVAGAAALVRQYFMSGFYPSGARRQADALAPSGALLKAVLINGAAALNGFADGGVPLAPPPSRWQGFGRVNLGTEALPLASAAAADAVDAPHMFVADGVSVGASETHRFCLQLAPPGTSQQPLRVTLTWQDPPALPSAAGPKLINDLDLRVTPLGPGGGAAPLAGAGGATSAWAAANRLDNVERVVLPARGGTYLVAVRGFAVPWPAEDTDGQPYALAATGPGLCGARLADGAPSCAEALADACSSSAAGVATPPPPPLLLRSPPQCSLWLALFGRKQCSSG